MRSPFRPSPHEEKARIAAAHQAKTRKYDKLDQTPERAALIAASAEESARLRPLWQELDQERRLMKALPREPRLIVSGGRNWCELTDVAGMPLRPSTGVLAGEDQASWMERRRIEAMAERVALAWVLDAIKPSLIIHGGARGADRWCGLWADKRGVPIVVEAADWSLGHRAGPMRNQRMIDVHAPTAGVTFPGGAGTRDCAARMAKAGLPIYEARVLAGLG